MLAKHLHGYEISVDTIFISQEKCQYSWDLLIYSSTSSKSLKLFKLYSNCSAALI